MGQSSGLPMSDGQVERARADVIHFTKQSYFRTDLPSIFQPHDLQHVHLPQFFSNRERMLRDHLYREACQAASLIAASSSWVRDDLIAQYGVQKDKIAVIPPAPVLNAYPTPTEEDCLSVRREFGLPEKYLFYPAQTWPHKNHLALIKAVSMVRERTGERINLVFSGTRTNHAPIIEREVDNVGLRSQVTFVGFVNPLQLQVLYKLSRGVVIPTQFEAASFPMWEAFLAGVPVACSNVTSLPKQGGDAALMFDPTRTEEIADAILILWTDSKAGKQLAAHGLQNVSRFTWELTAKTFRAYYRRLGGATLTTDDQLFMNSDPIL